MDWSRMKLRRIIHKLLIGLLLRCPNCERGRMFNGLFQMNALCPECGARFERREGESVGGMAINLILAELLTVGGLIVTELTVKPSLVFQLSFWIVFNILFVVFFYRHARALWVSTVYLSGGVYPDPEQPSPQGTP
jgi:uncharacterized protein (DUF983 family)